MPSVLRISEAASLGLHTMVLLAAVDGKRMSAKDIAALLQVSEAHLSKVMQRLGRQGLVYSARGPKGGFTLAKAGDEIMLREVFEAIEGPLLLTECLLGNQICDGSDCILGSLLVDVNKRVIDYFDKTSLSELTKVYERDGFELPKE